MLVKPTETTCQKLLDDLPKVQLELINQIKLSEDREKAEESYDGEPLYNERSFRAKLESLLHWVKGIIAGLSLAVEGRVCYVNNLTFERTDLNKLVEIAEFAEEYIENA